MRDKRAVSIRRIQLTTFCMEPEGTVCNVYVTWINFRRPGVSSSRPRSKSKTAREVRFECWVWLPRDDKRALSHICDSNCQRPDILRKRVEELDEVEAPDESSAIGKSDEVVDIHRSVRTVSGWQAQRATNNRPMEGKWLPI